MACVHTLIRNVKNLLSKPEIGMKVSAMLKNDDVSLAEVGKLIEQDPAISAAVLRIANSSLLGARKEIISVNRAMLRLGTEQTAELAIGISVANSFKGIDANIVTVNSIWRHSMYCATAARVLAGNLKLADRDAAFTAGLLHDIGRLVLLGYLPEEMNSVHRLTQATAEREAMDEIAAERKVLGFDHGEAGELLAWQWKLPVIVSRCMRYHHAPADAPSDSLMPWVVHLANAIAHAIEEGLDDIDYDSLEPATLAKLGIGAAELPDVIAAVRVTFDEVEVITPVAA